MVVFLQHWFYSGKVGCIRAKCWLVGKEIECFRSIGLYLGKSSCFLARWLYSGKMAVFGQLCCIRAKWLYLGETGLFEESSCIRTKLVIFVKK